MTELITKGLIALMICYTLAQVGRIIYWEVRSPSSPLVSHKWESMYHRYKKR